MRICVYSTKSYDRTYLSREAGGHEFVFLEPHLNRRTASLAKGANAVCAFVNDTLDAETLQQLSAAGVRLVLLRCAGFNHVDLDAAEALGIAVARVPAYSPHAVAEHTVGLMLVLNRRIHRAFNRVREGNFALDGLIGFDMVDKTVGVIGTGAIGAVVCRILIGFGCTVVANDPERSQELEAIGVRYVADLRSIFETADIVTLHCPLTPDTYHLVDDALLARSKPNLMLINTSRGALVDTKAVIASLKENTLGALGLDVYEEEAGLFFHDLSDTVLRDDVFARLLTFPNVVVTGHQAFLTDEALSEIARTTRENADAFAATGVPKHPVYR